MPPLVSNLFNWLAEITSSELFLLLLGLVLLVAGALKLLKPKLGSYIGLITLLVGVYLVIQYFGLLG